MSCTLKSRDDRATSAMSYDDRMTAVRCRTILDEVLRRRTIIDEVFDNNILRIYTVDLVNIAFILIHEILRYKNLNHFRVLL